MVAPAEQDNVLLAGSEDVFACLASYRRELRGNGPINRSNCCPKHRQVLFRHLAQQDGCSAHKSLKTGTSTHLTACKLSQNQVVPGCAALSSCTAAIGWLDHAATG